MANPKNYYVGLCNKRPPQLQTKMGKQISKGKNEIFEEDDGDMYQNFFGPKKLEIKQFNSHDCQSQMSIKELGSPLKRTQLQNQPKPSVSGQEKADLFLQKKSKSIQDEFSSNNGKQMSQEIRQMSRSIPDMSSSSQLKIQQLVGITGKSSYAPDNKFRNQLLVYQYYIARYNFIADVQDVINSIPNLDQEKKYLTSYCMAKQLLFFCQEILNSLQNNVNIFNLENFQDFVASELKAELEDSVKMDYDRWQKKLKSGYISIDLQAKYIKNQANLKNFITENLIETNYNKQIKGPLRSILNPLFILTKQQGTTIYEKEKMEMCSDLSAVNVDKKGLNESVQSTLSIHTNHTTKSYKNHQKTPFYIRRRMYSSHADKQQQQQQAEQTRQNDDDDDENNNNVDLENPSSYFFLIPCLGILVCMVINTVFDKSDVRKTFAIYFEDLKKKHEKIHKQQQMMLQEEKKFVLNGIILEESADQGELQEKDEEQAKYSFDFWKFITWIENAEAGKLLDQIDLLVKTCFGGINITVNGNNNASSSAALDQHADKQDPSFTSIATPKSQTNTNKQQGFNAVSKQAQKQ